jgi:hypothetical protein
LYALIFGAQSLNYTTFISHLVAKATLQPIKVVVAIDFMMALPILRLAIVMALSIDLDMTMLACGIA